MRYNPLILTDSYKVSHYRQYPPGTESVFSYWESRGGNFPYTVFFGLNGMLKDYYSTPITQLDVEYAARRWAKHFMDDQLFNREGFQRIVDVHGGFWPVRIRAVPEGTVVPLHHALMTVENTDPKLPWVTNFLETHLSQLWYPTTVATQSRMIRSLIGHFLLETDGDTHALDGLLFKLHDFGFRGVSSVESAAIGGAAHLVNFMGTDTAAGFEYAMAFYGEEMAGFSIPAAEHSTITTWEKEHEIDAFKNMLDQFGGGNLVAVVSDSYDIDNATRNLWAQLKDQVLGMKAVLVVRPDSGIPHEVVPRVLNNLGEVFGTVKTSKGYKLLNPKVRVIQGDGVDYEEIRRILQAMQDQGWAANNVAFGMGGALLQKLNRDTLKFAFKACSANVNGKERDVWKSPASDMSKASKRGRLTLIQTDGGDIQTVRENEWRQPSTELLQTVWENGKLLVDPTFAEIRERAKVVF